MPSQKASFSLIFHVSFLPDGATLIRPTGFVGPVSAAPRAWCYAACLRGLIVFAGVEPASHFAGSNNASSAASAREIARQ
ncbi:hypothetical protein CKO_05038 [Citrobacter koseri ATCC BAA-895]|uniref:Uncharacterized protein n=1 Tax=Citrobacter koseri (strain ATCC BAA-895 / CDC 4225-83 / SGSC4696) TaxID=290338 RepID=A8ARG7_CITK8|nr:hypothetical protein CKO_05038 [Citrobacter koseri ATCC BAA-895]